MARKKLTYEGVPEDAPFMFRLRQLVEQNRDGRTDREIAAAAGISGAYFSRLMLGNIPDPRFSTIKAILDGIGCGFNDLIPGPDPQKSRVDPRPRSVLGYRLLKFAVDRYGSLNDAVVKNGLNHAELFMVIRGKDPRVSTLERIVVSLKGTMVEFYSVDASGYIDRR